jgi:selenium metabolism protein YedF
MAKTFWIISDTLGSGDEELGRALMRNFLYSLARAEERPARVLLMNGGVKLACEGADTLDDLRLMTENGVIVKACGTCLGFFHLKDRLGVGEAGDMAGSVSVLSGDADVVTVG